MRLDRKELPYFKKLDYQFESDDRARDLDGFNFGVGWQF